jgi:uncharacterized Zn finger protein
MSDSLTLNWTEKMYLVVCEKFGVTKKQMLKESERCEYLFFEIEKGRIKSKIQRGKQKPIYTEIRFKYLNEKNCRDIEKDILEQPLLKAKLLSGSLPDTVEKVFKRYDISLSLKVSDFLNLKITGVDERSEHLYFSCLMNRFIKDSENDPLLLFKMRGFDVESFKEKLKNSRGGEVEVSKGKTLVSPQKDKAGFWGNADVVGLADKIKYAQKNPLENLCQKLPFLSDNEVELRKIYKFLSSKV